VGGLQSLREHGPRVLKLQYKHGAPNMSDLGTAEITSTEHKTLVCVEPTITTPTLPSFVNPLFGVLFCEAC
jgi:hypothetical protein